MGAQAPVRDAIVFGLPMLSISSLLLAVGAVLFLAYVCSVCWLLRGESRRALLLLLVTTGIGAFLRFYDVWNLPPGMNDDEFKTLRLAAEVLQTGDVFILGYEGPILWAVLFQAPVAAALDSVFWGMRLYPLVLSVLSVPVVFAACRGLRFREGASLVGAFLAATLPWALFWGRMPWGGEIFFYEALLLAGLCRIIWRDGSWGNVVVAVLGLVGLLYEYTAAWAMFGLVPLALLLARTWRQRILCSSVLLLGIAFWLPWLLHPERWKGAITSKVAAGATSDGAMAAVVTVLRTFVFPEGHLYWISVPSAAVHPVVVLVVAALGVLLVPVRRSLFIAFAFLGGLVPAILSCSGAASTHRSIGAFMLVPIAAAACFERLSDVVRPAFKRAASLVALVFCALTAVQSWAIFTGSPFWQGTERVFVSGETLATERIRFPITTPTYAESVLAYILYSRGDTSPGHKYLSYENWMPSMPSTYLYTGNLGGFADWMKAALPPDQVEEFGVGPAAKSYIARVTEADLPRLRGNGWTYRRSCVSGRESEVQIPLFIVGQPLGWGSSCGKIASHTVRGVWLGQPGTLALHVSARTPTDVTVKTSSGFSSAVTVRAPVVLEVAVATGESVTVSATEAELLSLRLLVGGIPAPFGSSRVPVS